MRTHSNNIERWAREAILQAEVETLADGRIFARVPSCVGAVATGGDEREALDNLFGVLQDWALVGMRLKDDIPVIGEVNLNTDDARQLA